MTLCCWKRREGGGGERGGLIERAVHKFTFDVIYSGLLHLLDLVCENHAAYMHEAPILDM